MTPQRRPKRRRPVNRYRHPDHRYYLARCLARYRDEAGLTNAEIAKRLDVCAPAVTNWMNAFRCPPPAMLRSVLEILAVSEDRLRRDMEGFGYRLTPPSPVGPTWWERAEVRP